MNVMAAEMQHSGVTLNERSSSMSKSQWKEFAKLAERAKDRLVQSGAWQTEVEARKEVTARVKEAARSKEAAADA